MAVSILSGAGQFIMARRGAPLTNHSRLAVASVDAAVAASVPAGMAFPRAGSAQEIWLVDKSAAFEIYSNGLRIDNKFSTANHPRSYLAFASASSGATLSERRTEPAGIVYHTTESLQEPFEAAQNRKLKKVGESLLDYVKGKKAYNFVIDRFGRVFRVVRETDAAEHAGYSVWADEKWLYVNLNESFLAVSLETGTQPGQVEAAVTAAQIRAAAMLTEMLRGRYRIAAGNCVTHAQVSVSPSRMLAGYHMDWASSFPFEEIGLPNNYALPLPSIAAFGFRYDANYARVAGVRLSEGARLGERELETRALAAGMSVPAYRKARQKQYRELLAATRGAVVSHEGD
jgi:N-acetylmuramoyl-L-alanine amidase